MILDLHFCFLHRLKIKIYGEGNQELFRFKDFFLLQLIEQIWFTSKISSYKNV
jgi:hypothetical protein